MNRLASNRLAPTEVSVRSRLAALAGCALLLSGSCREPRNQQREELAQALSQLKQALSAAPSAPSAKANSAAAAAASEAVEQALVEIRKTRLSLALPASLPRHLAFGKDFVVALQSSRAVLLNSADGNQIAQLEVQAPRAAVSLVAGSVLVAAADSTLRFDPGQKKPHQSARLSLLPGFLLQPSLQNLDKIWVVEPDQRRLQRYALVTTEGLGIESDRELLDYDRRAFCTLRDGTFLYTGGDALLHSFASGKPARLPLPSGLARIWRLLPATRIDQAWAALENGDLVLLSLEQRVRVLRTVSSGLRFFDLAVDSRNLLVVSVDEQTGKAPSFALTAFQFDGSRLWSVPLGVAEVSGGRDWVSRATADYELVLDPSARRLAVGGPHRLRVFETESGKQLWQRASD